VVNLHDRGGSQISKTRRNKEPESVYRFNQTREKSKRREKGVRKRILHTEFRLTYTFLKNREGRRMEIGETWEVRRG